MGTNAVAPRDAAGDFYDLARPVQSDPFRFQLSRPQWARQWLGSWRISRC
jgi:hypothetical protein